jgi:protein-S-isoprenylcysteine O-methyltransferase Ste14
MAGRRLHDRGGAPGPAVATTTITRRHSTWQPNPSECPRGAFLANVFFSLITYPAVVLLLAGDWRWLEGWLFGLWMSAMVLSSMIYLYLKDPALLAERTRRIGSGNQKKWDTYLLIAIFTIAVLWLALMMLGAPLLLGSLYGLIISVLAVFVLVGRILGEEKMLVTELEGYADYQKRSATACCPGSGRNRRPGSRAVPAFEI